jgi:hypothetical protein
MYLEGCERSRKETLFSDPYTGRLYPAEYILYDLFMKL